MAQSEQQERLAQAQFQAGEVSRAAVAAARVERTTAALALLAARFNAQEVLGQVENALQVPAELAASVELSQRPLGSE
jgi:hypothetical protein